MRFPKIASRRRRLFRAAFFPVFTVVSVTAFTMTVGRITRPLSITDASVTMRTLVPVSACAFTAVQLVRLYLFVMRLTTPAHPVTALGDVGLAGRLESRIFEEVFQSRLVARPVAMNLFAGGMSTVVADKCLTHFDGRRVRSLGKGVSVGGKLGNLVSTSSWQNP